MKFSQVSEHIYSLSIWMIVPIHVWLVRQEDGMTLVDAGVPPMARGIQREVQRIGNGPITRILLTHGHVDHVGAIRSIVKSEDVRSWLTEVRFPIWKVICPIRVGKTRNGR